MNGMIKAISLALGLALTAGVAMAATPSCPRPAQPDGPSKERGCPRVA